MDSWEFETVEAVESFTLVSHEVTCDSDPPAPGGWGVKGLSRPG